MKYFIGGWKNSESSKQGHKKNKKMVLILAPPMIQLRKIMWANRDCIDIVEDILHDQKRQSKKKRA